jgi:hypothetical protein
MAIDDFMLDSSLTIYPREGQGAFGAVLGAAYDEPAHVEPWFRKITNKLGEEVICKLFAIVGPECAAKVGDQTLVDGVMYVCVDVRPLMIEGEAHHVELYFGVV